MSPETWPTLDAVETALNEPMDRNPRRPFVLGLCGAQGSGKSTLAERIARKRDARGTRTALLSLDDLYLTRAEREELARTVHPLLRTRGVPGTHDTKLGLQLLRDLDAGKAVELPCFDKAADDRAPRESWSKVTGDIDLLLFEGWCVGARPEPEAALAEPVNALERDEDPDGIWRRFVNNRLAGDYQQLFARIDLLVLLAAPSFDVVQGWRTEQEDELRARASGATHAIMSESEIARFIQHYERLTRHILAEMPGRADLLLRLNKDRSLLSVERRGYRP